MAENITVRMHRIRVRKHNYLCFVKYSGHRKVFNSVNFRFQRDLRVPVFCILNFFYRKSVNFGIHVKGQETGRGELYCTDINQN